MLKFQWESWQHLQTICFMIFWFQTNLMWPFMHWSTLNLFVLNHGTIILFQIKNSLGLEICYIDRVQNRIVKGVNCWQTVIIRSAMKSARSPWRENPVAKELLSNETIPENLLIVKTWIGHKRNSRWIIIQSTIESHIGTAIALSSR